jgi:hypothetical protein
MLAVEGTVMSLFDWVKTFSVMMAFYSYANTGKKKLLERISYYVN